jgi:hypothetical protein
MDMQTITVKAARLRAHPGQMRTRLDPQALADLTMQVCTRGLGPDRPIVVARNDGSTALAEVGQESSTYRVVKGHRRWLAALLAEEVRVQADGRKGAVDLDFVTRVVGSFAGNGGREIQVCAACKTQVEHDDDVEGWYCPACEDYVEAVEAAAPDNALIEAYTALTERYGDVELPVVLSDFGDSKTEQLALLADNFGAEEPDVMGQARGFVAAAKHGASAREIAAHTGLTTNRVNALLALADAPSALAEAVTGGKMPLGVVTAMARLKSKAQREGLAACILAAEYSWRIEDVDRVVAALREWKPAQPSLDPQQPPASRNGQRLLAALWQQAVKKDAVQAWVAAAEYGARRWDSRLLDRLAETALGRVPDDQAELLYDLVPEARCETCQLRESLAGIAQSCPGAHFRHPCACGQEAKACQFGIGPQDPFWVEAPWNWDGFPGVQSTPGRGAFCASAEDFAAARAAHAQSLEEAEEQSQRLTGSNGDGGYVLPCESAEKAEDVAEQRAFIRSFILHHEELDGHTHPLATLCANCRYRLDGSPTKDPSVPPCQWAARRHTVEFAVRVPVEGEGLTIPLCRQYAPRQAWSEIIPQHPAPPPALREWELVTIGLMARDIDDLMSHGDRRKTCEFLTGRPMKVSDNHSGSFQKALDEQKGGLADAQVWMLFLWVVGDWAFIAHNQPYPLASPNGLVTPYVERRWPFAPEGTPEVAGGTTAEDAEAEKAGEEPAGVKVNEEG